MTMLSAVLVSELMFAGELDESMFIKINLYTIVLYWAIRSIVFFGSAIADDSKISLGIGDGVPVFFLIVQMLSGVGEDFR